MCRPPHTLEKPETDKYWWGCGGRRHFVLWVGIFNGEVVMGNVVYVLHPKGPALSLWLSKHPFRRHPSCVNTSPAVWQLLSKHPVWPHPWHSPSWEALGYLDNHVWDPTCLFLLLGPCLAALPLDPSKGPHSHLPFGRCPHVALRTWE